MPLFWKKPINELSQMEIIIYFYLLYTHLDNLGYKENTCLKVSLTQTWVFFQRTLVYF